MKAIRTRYLGPTNTKGSRIKADDGDGNSMIVSYDHRYGIDENHRLACKALQRKLNWAGRYYGGGMPHSRYWVCIDKDYFSFYAGHEEG